MVSWFMFEYQEPGEDCGAGREQIGTDLANINSFGSSQFIPGSPLLINF